MNIIPADDFNTRLDKHIKDAFKEKLKPTHPCEHQKKNCLKGSACPLIGLPNDMCTYHVSGKCNRNNCQNTHYEEYARIYKQAKQQFKKEEDKPLATIRRYLNRFTPHLMWFFGLIFSYLIRRALDYFAKKII
jgi:hypothetical protein